MDVLLLVVEVGFLASGLEYTGFWYFLLKILTELKHAHGLNNPMIKAQILPISCIKIITLQQLVNPIIKSNNLSITTALRIKNPSPVPVHLLIQILKCSLLEWDVDEHYHGVLFAGLFQLGFVTVVVISRQRRRRGG